MAAINRFYIGQIDGQGLQTDLKPYAIPDSSFAELNNAYVFRGRVKKRFGSQLMYGTASTITGLEQIQSRLKINIGTTDGSGNLSVTVPGAVFGIGQAFSCGSEFFTVYQTGTPAAMLKTGSSTVATYNTTTGALVINGSNATTDVYFYPATPVMGIGTYEQSGVNDEQAIAFDTQFAYYFGANGWEKYSDSPVFTGTNAQFFWSTNWRGISAANIYFFETNYNDPIYYYNGSNWKLLGGDLPSGTPDGYTKGGAIVSNTDRIQTARIIVPFKGRMLYLNVVQNAQGTQFSSPNLTNTTTGNFNQTVAGTYYVGQQFVAGNTIYTIASAAAGLQNMTVASYPGLGTPPTAQFNLATGNLVITGNGNNRGVPVYFFDFTTSNLSTYSNRCFYSLIGDPTLTNGTLIWPGLGGALDAPTKEAIVTAQFLKDRLIVYFESSTWELVDTGNAVSPFVWQKINTELGAESTFSQVPFDKVVLGVGNVGIHACNGYNVERIDQKIPTEVFRIHNNNNGPQRVAGIRDYYTELVYWSFPGYNRSDDFPFNNKVLAYNYKNDTWSFNDDSVTAFGYFQSTVSGSLSSLTWAQADMAWQDANFAWTSGTLQAKFRNIIAGNQEGYVFIINPDLSSNCPALQITNLTYTSGFTATAKVYNHNLSAGDYVKVTNCQGVTELNNLILQVASVTDANTVVLDILYTTVTGTYTGGGTLSRVTPIDFKTKQFNFYAESGRNAYISKVDFLVDRTTNGQCVVDFLIGSSSYSMLTQNNGPQALVGTSILETSPYALVPFESQQDRLWHPVYFWAEGEYVQFHFYLNYDQSRNPLISESDFQLFALMIYAQPTTSRLQ
jgi:hypothetical protein